MTASFILGEKLEYEITFMGLPAAKVYVEVSDTTFLDFPAKNINYKTHTTSFINSFFSVENKYQTITNYQFTKILKFNKQTHHPNLDDTISAEINISQIGNGL